MKKITTILLSAMLCFTLIACSHNEETSNILDKERNTESTHTIFEKSKIYNREQKYGFLDHTMFPQYYTGGTLRAGTDFDEGEYYIMSLYEPTPIYNVADNPSDLSWSSYGIIRKISISKGQYISTDGDILVPANYIDTNNWHKYGAYLVGQDLPAGDYKVTTLAEEYNSEIQHIDGISGGYQISNDTPFNTPVECYPLFDGHDYISLIDGQYITLINAYLQHVDDIEPKTDTTMKIDETADNTGDSETFIAKGETSLMNFLNNATVNGYDIIKPSRNGSYVNAKAKNEKSIFDIKYMVEDQKVYMVEITADGDGKTSTNYKQCIFGLAKSLNPDIQDDLLNQNIEKAISTPNKKVIDSETLLIFDEEKAIFTITH